MACGTVLQMVEVVPKN